MTAEPTTSPTAETMRAWARGSYPCQAGVELLIRSGLADRLDEVPPWAERPGPAFDPELVGDLIETGDLSEGQQRIAAIALSLLSGSARPPDGAVDLPEVLAGIDRADLDLVLAGLAHAGGSHQHREIADGLDGPAITAAPGGYLPALHPWPGQR